ncbi:hypothetical protein NliqN6_1302 [Naganishia liquefaciens]|uniref:Transmembrane protein n=1 Tax=Naganishia liquefaciens TaxID=104408 RepID=A0A8H3TQT0_9TREE|nr:hypothetical protein NliqN6_1302 [Naganishia liquefaciens]
MVAYNMTLDNISPMIQYTGYWSNKHSDDTQKYLYFDQTYTSTRNEGDTAVLRFNGTGIWAFGAKRADHGKYRVELDSTVMELDGFAEELGTMQTVLYSQTGLNNTLEHVLTLTNAEGKWFDIDYFVVQHEELDQLNELQLQTVTMDCPSPEFFTYTGDWNFRYRGEEYHNRTAAMAYAVNDSIAFSFTGTSVAVYGAVNMNHGIYTVTCDGVSADYSGFYDAGPKSLTGGAVLFHRANLENVSHTVTLINRGAKPTNFFGIDYVQYNYTTPRPFVPDPVGEPLVPVAKIVSAIPTILPTDVRLTSSLDAAKPTSISVIPSIPTFSTSKESSASATPSISASAVMGGSEPLAGQTRPTLSGGALAGIITGAITSVIIVALLVWFVVRKRKQDETIYPWRDQRPLACSGSASDPHSPMALTGSPLSPYQDTPFTGGRYPNATWTTNPLPQMVQREPFVSGAAPARPHVPASNATSYYPYAQSVVPPTEIGEPDSAASKGTHSTERAYSGLGRGSPFHHTAPSSGAMPSEMGDTEIRVASHAEASLPNILSLSAYPSSHHITGLSPYLTNSGGGSTARSSTPTSSQGSGSFGRRKQGVALPVTSRQPSSVLSQEQLRQVRMVVEGRLQDWGPVPEEHILPPDYSQATEPLPGQVPDGPENPRRF